jgi:type IV fimbrial biogenesis protein FimT
MAVGSDKRAIGIRGTARGFGLIELVITIAIVAILTVIALPSYSRIIRQNRVVTDTNTLLSALNLARNEAVARGRPITVCASTNGTSCDGVGTVDWSQGWMVFTDYDPVGVVDAGSGDTVLRVFGPVATQDVLGSVGSTSGYVSFGRTGVARFPDATLLAISFLVRPTPCDTTMLRTVTITNLGRSASSSTGACP